MRAVIIGAVESTRRTLAAVARAPGWTAAAVATLPATLAGRHSDFVDLAPDAAAAGARLIAAADCNAPDAVAQVADATPDVLLVIGWSQLVGSELLATAAGGAIGYHPAPLPRLRGRGVIPWTILLGEPITASTLFWIDGGVDTGPILGQRFLHVAPDETARSLYDRHMTALDTLLADALPRIAAGDAPRAPQDERFATWAAKRTPADGAIDWTRSAAEIERLVRAVGEPYPGAFTDCRGERLTIWRARVALGSAHAAATPGQVATRDADGFGVRCGCGALLRVEAWTSASGRQPALHARLGGAPC